MSYSIYTTRGFIINSMPSGEASKIYIIYTESFGLIFARAQGVRLISSKLKHSLNDYNFVNVSLVKGKEFWRLTNVENISVRKDNILIKAKILSLVRRLVFGEEKNDHLFSALLDLENETVDLKNMEVSCLVKVLSSLGYLDSNSLSNLTESETLKLINKALKETHL